MRLVPSVATALLAPALAFTACRKAGQDPPRPEHGSESARTPPDVGRTAGGSGGGPGSAPSGTAGGSAAGPHACPGYTPACSSLETFPNTSAISWVDGDDFHGGIRVFGSGVARSADTTALHVTGTVTGPGAGFSFWFQDCVSLEFFRGIRFTLSGHAPGAAGEKLALAFQTNADHSWQTDPTGRVGACTPPDGAAISSYCVAPSVLIPLASSPTEIPWADVHGGKPVPWDAISGPKQLVALEFTFPWDANSKPYAVDVSFDHLLFLSPAAIPCTLLP
ncbi:MAG TPA: hypothetical protein VGQ57_11890 [Polyangiaceae bacterium]|jgi:hypothetical protein|nr:hypothetical protein [Polyangiaceae bacterium]